MTYLQTRLIFRVIMCVYIFFGHCVCTSVYIYIYISVLYVLVYVQMRSN